MSERLRVTNNPVSNEEIIKELTEQFDIFPREDQTQTTKDSSEGIIAPENKAEAEDSSIGSKHSKLKIPEKHELEDFDDDQDDDGKNYDSDSDSTDSIDEVALKDQEVVLTEEERVQRKEKAEELKKIGNQAFGEGEYRTSKCKYTEALKICPLEYSQQRAVLYCNRSAAKIHLEMYAEAIKDATKAIELDDKYIKAYYRRATSYEHTDKLDECLADYKRIVELDPHEAVATKALERLPPLIEARNEKLKTEMMGKLKDLGNMILKPFGLSTDNFQMEQDPETKGYKMGSCRRRRKRCRSRSGKFKRCRSRDRRYRVPQRMCRRCGGVRRRCRRKSRCRGRRPGRPRYLWRCRSRSGAFKRCRRCDRRYKIKKRRG